MQYFLKENYYFDIDHLNQIRIAGPENHLLLGLSFPQDVKIEVKEYEMVDGQLEVRLKLETKELQLAIPLVCDIRSLRSETEPVIPSPTYSELVSQDKIHLFPRQVERVDRGEFHGWQFVNSYQDQDLLRMYGAEMLVKKGVEFERDDKVLKIKGEAKKLVILLRTQTDITITDQLHTPLFRSESLESETLDQWLVELYAQAGREVEHLVRTRKTSSFEYGTIFPRDWIEAADLGEDDFTQEAIDYMYEQSMFYINEKGEGWHEEIIGDYKTKVTNLGDLIDRKMIDIEPHYILGFDRMSADFLSREDIRHKFRLTAQFVVNNALEQEYISFKRVGSEEEVHYMVGNWRDSSQAFPQQRSPLAPYDVNCVFYPEAIRVIGEHRDYFGMDGIDWEKLQEKWDRHKLRFRLYHPDDLVGYALALHGKKQLPLPVAHLDEAYDLFYNRPSWEEVDSFARKVIDPEYFYTPVGPILVDGDADEFSTKQYHGKVIWPKQVAFVVAGLGRQYRYGLEHGWPLPLLATVRKSIVLTAEASFRAWRQLVAVPELYYYDKESQEARFYTDQESYEGQMSLVQLWSAVGCRRIIREYEWIRSRVEPEEMS